MRLLFIPLLLALTLAGCVTDGVGTPSTGIGTNSGIKNIQAAAVSICKYLPAATFVSNLLLSGNLIAMTAEAVAGKICEAVTLNPLADGPGAKNYKPHVNGIRVKGKFVR